MSQHQWSLSVDRGSSGLIIQQSQLAKVISFLVILDTSFLSIHQFVSLCLSSDNQIKVIRSLALSEHVFPLCDFLFFQCLCDLCALIIIHGAEYLAFLQTGLIHLPSILTRILNDIIKRIPIQLKQHCIGLGNYRSRSGRIIQKRQFPETLPRLITFEMLRLVAALEGFKTV